MNQWDGYSKLWKLQGYYQCERENPRAISDEIFLNQIETCFWPSNCLDFAEASLVMVIPGCILRPHLTHALLHHPMEALMAGGVNNSESILQWGSALLHKEECYVSLTPEIREWLEIVWPNMGDIVQGIWEE